MRGEGGMTCERVLELAIELLDGTLGGPARAAVDDHLARCADCRELIAALREAPSEDPELTSAILRRTAGPVCESVWDRLCARADGALDPIEDARVSGHLGRCPECAGLDRALSSMRVALPRLADADSDPEFVRAVLARTSLAPRRAPLAETWRESLRRLLDRPRIALEGAFVAAMILVVPLGAFQGRGGDSQAHALDAIRHASGAASARLNMLAHTAWATTREFVAERAAGIVPGTFSSAGASGQTSDGTTAQETR